MMDDNLEKFFKQELNKFEGSGENWEFFGDDILENAMEQSEMFGTTASKLSFLPLLKTVTIVFLLGYIGYLHYSINQANQSSKTIQSELQERHKQEIKAVQEALTILENNNNQKANVEQSAVQKTPVHHSNPIFSKKNSQQQTNFNPFIQQLKQQNQNLEDQLLQKTKALDQLQIAYNDLKDSLTVKNANAAAKKHQKDIIQSLASKNIALLPNTWKPLEALNFPSTLPSDDDFKKAKKWRVGYELGFNNLEMPTQRTYESIDAITVNETQSTLSLNTHSLTIERLIRPNIELHTGLKFATTDIEQFNELSATYNSDREYSKGVGLIGNDIVLGNVSPYFRTDINASLTFRQGEELEDGDILILSLAENQQVQFLQIPLGATYLFDTGKWQWSLLGGIEFNQLRLNNYRPTLRITNLNREIQTEDILFNTTSPIFNFWNVYGGLGFNYQLSSSWQTTTKLTYQYGFNHGSSNNFNPRLSLGLRYKF